MSSAGWRVNRAAGDLGEHLGGQDAGPGGGRRAPENLRENRVTVASDIETVAHLRRDLAGRLGVHDGGDIFRGVKARQSVGAGQRAIDIAGRVVPAQRGDQIQGRRHPRDR